MHFSTHLEARNASKYVVLGGETGNAVFLSLIEIQIMFHQELLLYGKDHRDTKIEEPQVPSAF